MFLHQEFEMYWVHFIKQKLHIYKKIYNTEQIMTIMLLHCVAATCDTLNIDTL